MALDNSMDDPKWCGVNNELQILQTTGCCAAFSMPTAPGISQARKINSICYAVADPAPPQSYDAGVDSEVGVKDQDGLLIIAGPLAFGGRHRKYRILPHIDNADIKGGYPGTPDRVRRWVRQHVHVKGRPEWVIVKVSCHGAEERHFAALLEPDADRMYSCLEASFCDRFAYRLHHVTARELFNVVKAAEAGCEGSPGDFSDFLFPPYRNRPLAFPEHRDSRGQ